MQDDNSGGNNHAPRGLVLITGGAGFIGVNLAARLLADGRRVLVYDNVSRAGVAENLRWLSTRFPQRLGIIVADVRDREALMRAMQGSEVVFHLAAQDSVAASVADPTLDFDINARGTLNVIEAVRRQATPPALIHASTREVYGDLGDLPLREADRRYVVARDPEELRGIGEARPLHFQTPYGCAKGAADQYVLDSARTFGLPACVLRLGCVYGPHQIPGLEEGWIAHSIGAALRDRPALVAGDGKQVRDLLYVDDLVEALVLAADRIAALRGQACNVGGGAANALSLLELLELLGALHGRKIGVRYEEWRAGDQRFYVSDTRRFSRETGWRPRTSVHNGLEQTYRWMAQHREVGDGDLVGANGRNARDPAAVAGPPDE